MNEPSAQMIHPPPSYAIGANGQPATAIDRVVGVLIALYVLVGRWSPSRISDSDIAGSLFEPRIWIVAILAVLTVLCDTDPNADRNAGTRRRITYSLTGLFVYLIVSALWALPGEYRSARVVDVAILLICTVSIYRLLGAGNAPSMARWFWITISICGVILILFASTSQMVRGQRMAALGGGPNVFGRNMGLLFIAALSMMDLSASRWYWAPAVVIAPLMTVMSGSRGAVLGLIAAVVVCVILRRFRVHEAMIVACCLGIAIFFLSQPDRWGAFSDVYERRFKTFGLDSANMDGRRPLYGAAIDLGKEHPIAGAGLSSYSALWAEYGYTYPHNLILEVFSEGGVIGLIFLLMALGAGMWQALKARGEKTWAPFAALALMLVASQISGDLYDSRAIFVFLLMALAPSGTARDDAFITSTSANEDEEAG